MGQREKHFLSQSRTLEENIFQNDYRRHFLQILHSKVSCLIFVLVKKGSMNI